MRDEVADYQYSDRSHGCEAPSKYALGNIFVIAS